MRLYVVVEGQTEEEFVKRTIGPHLTTLGINVTAIIVTTKRDRKTGKKIGRGGGHWKHWLSDLRRLMSDQVGNNVRFTTLFDLYGLPDDFPNLEVHRGVANTIQRAELLEKEMQATVDDYRLIPYLQRHEFEALVLAGLESLQLLLDAKDDLEGLEQLRAALKQQCPEDVDDGVETAPSKRLAASIPGYVKALYGPLVVEHLGLAKIRKTCPRFNDWLKKLELLQTGSEQ